MAVAFGEVDVENAEEVVFRKVAVLFVEDLILIVEGGWAGGQDAGDLLDVGEIVFEEGAKGWSHGAEVKGDDAFGVVEAPGDAPDAVRFGVVTVVAGLVEDIGQDEEAAGKTGTKSKEVDEGDEFVFGEIPEGDLQIIFEHDDGFGLLRAG